MLDISVSLLRPHVLSALWHLNLFQTEGERLKGQYFPLFWVFRIFGLSTPFPKKHISTWALFLSLSHSPCNCHSPLYFSLTPLIILLSHWHQCMFDWHILLQLWLVHLLEGSFLLLNCMERAVPTSIPPKCLEVTLTELHSCTRPKYSMIQTCVSFGQGFERIHNPILSFIIYTFVFLLIFT